MFLSKFPVLMLLIPFCIVATDATDCGSNPADIVFLLDSSGSVGPSNFVKQKNFVAKFAGAFDIGPRNVQIGVTTFSTRPHNEFNLNTYHDKMPLANKIRKIPYIAGGTGTDLALKYVEANSFTKASGDRAGVANMLIVMTDGQSNDPVRTNIQAQRLHEKKVKVFAIGIGAGVDVKELFHIATDYHHVFQVQSFDALDTIKSELTKTACKNSLPCTTPVLRRTLVDGGWSEYGSFSACTKSCGGGSQLRNRTCTNPVPVGSGVECPGNATETISCNTQDCLVPNTQGECTYKGMTYSQGQMWYDDCMYMCQCTDGATGQYRCQERCPTYVDMSAQCIYVPDPKDPVCCSVPWCVNTPVTTPAPLYAQNGQPTASVTHGIFPVGTSTTMTDIPDTKSTTSLDSTSSVTTSSNIISTTTSTGYIGTSTSHPNSFSHTSVTIQNVSATAGIPQQADTACRCDTKTHIILCLIIGSVLFGVFMLSIIVRQRSQDKSPNKLSRMNKQVDPMIVEDIERGDMLTNNNVGAREVFKTKPIPARVQGALNF